MNTCSAGKVTTRVRGNMQLVNFSQDLLNIRDSHARGKEDVQESWRGSYLLPVGLLAVAIMASLLLGGHIKSQDELDWLTRLANTGDAGAQLQLGLAYRDGRYGLDPDSKTGLYWLRRSAKGGNIYAEDAIGKAYADGEGIPRDTVMAEQWWRKAIAHGNRAARIHLADTLIQAGHIEEGNALLN